jgi:hypothetical protein
MSGNKFLASGLQNVLEEIEEKESNTYKLD